MSTVTALFGDSEAAILAGLVVYWLFAYFAQRYQFIGL